MFSGSYIRIACFGRSSLLEGLVVLAERDQCVLFCWDHWVVCVCSPFDLAVGYLWFRFSSFSYTEDTVVS